MGVMIKNKAGRSGTIRDKPGQRTRNFKFQCPRGETPHTRHYLFGGVKKMKSNLVECAGPGIASRARWRWRGCTTGDPALSDFGAAKCGAWDKKRDDTGCSMRFCFHVFLGRF